MLMKMIEVVDNLITKQAKYCPTKGQPIMSSENMTLTVEFIGTLLLATGQHARDRIRHFFFVAFEFAKHH